MTISSCDNNPKGIEKGDSPAMQADIAEDEEVKKLMDNESDDKF